MSATGFGGSTLNISQIVTGPINSLDFTEVAGKDGDFLFVGTQAGDLNVTDLAFRVDYGSLYTLIHTADPADRYVLTDIGVDDVPDIIGVTLSTDIVGLDLTDITFTANSITISMTSIVVYPGSFFEIVPVFASVTTPDTTIYGSNNPDTLAGTNTGDRFQAKDGDDTVYAKFGNDTVEAGAGNDSVYGGSGDDRLYGQDGDDRMFGGDGRDFLYGDNGNDTLGGGLGDDRIRGGSGNDVVYGSVGNDQVWGEVGNDLIYGGDGNDTIWGGTGDDTIFGGPGADRFGFGTGSGNDIVYGLGDTDEIDLDGQTYTSALSAAGNLVLTLSGGGTVELFGVTDVNEDWFV